MRTPLLVGVVVFVHCVAVGSVVLIQGCGTLPAEPVTEPKMPQQVVNKRVTPLAIPSKPYVAPASTTYTVQNGDSLSIIAKRHGLSTAELSAANNIKNQNQIRVGQKLVIPGGAISMPEPVSPPHKPAATRKVTAEGPVYTVKSGDSLSVIAHAYGVKVGDIRDANGLSGDKIVVGQKLTIPGPTKTPAEVSAPVAEAPKPAVEVSAPAVDAPKPAVEVTTPVKPVPPAVVEKPAAVGASPAAGAAAKPAAGVLKDYTVEEGDDIFSIAMMWGVSVSRIREVNGLKDDELKVGQKIKIPLSE